MRISENDLNDLMITALEGGINYWCDDCKIVSNPKNKEYASEVLASGGEIKIHEDIGQWHNLTKETLKKGIEKAMKHFEYDKFQDFMDDHDAEFADVTIQLAIFDKIIYG